MRLFNPTKYINVKICGAKRFLDEDMLANTALVKLSWLLANEGANAKELISEMCTSKRCTDASAEKPKLRIYVEGFLIGVKRGLVSFSVE